MPKGIPGSGTPRNKKIRPETRRHYVRDLCLDLHRRVCTPYDSRTIIKNIEAKDYFNIILPRELLSLLAKEVEYDQGEINYEVLEQDEDEYSQDIAKIYKRMDAVIIRDCNG